MIFIAKIQFQLDSELPRDAVSINPCYFGDDPTALCNALKTNLLANTNVGATTPFKVRVYNAEKAPPSYPLAEASNGTGSKGTGYPREVALCLSYYSTFNRPGYRGRVYIPLALIGGTAGLRPSSTQMNTTLAYHNTLAKGLPAGHNMVVYSRKLAQSFGVSNFWVDDEWDTVRTRGTRATTRVLASIP